LKIRPFVLDNVNPQETTYIQAYL